MHNVLKNNNMVHVHHNSIRLKRFNLYPLADGDKCKNFRTLTEIHITLYYW